MLQTFNIINILSSAAVVIFIVSAFPQIIKLVKNKSAQDVSLWMALLIASGNLLMLIRAATVRDSFFLMNFFFQFVLWATIVVLIFKYRRR